MNNSLQGGRRRQRLRSSRTARSSGAEMLEFTVTFLPMLAMVFYLLNVTWAIFAKSTLDYAVRVGVRYGITVTGKQAAAAKSDLTSMVKNMVKSQALGLLSDTSKIQVHYLEPPDSGSSAAPTDVCGQAYGNNPGNVMQVSIVGFTLVPLAPRMFTWNIRPDKSATPLTAIAADLIEPSNDMPPMGSAP